MSCPTFNVPIGIPVFGLGFASNNQLIIGGGGGASRSGVKNKLASYKIDIRRKDLEEDATFEFESEEDAPMCIDIHPTEMIAVTGVNEQESNIKIGMNKNCRVFKILEDKFEHQKSLSTLESRKADDYQKVVRFSEDGTLFATGTTDGNVNVFKFPSYESLCQRINVVENDEILDVDFNLEKEKLICVLRDALKLINLRGKNTGQTVQTIPSSTLIKNMKSNFRAFRYGRKFTKDYGYAALNTVTKPGGHIIKFDAYSFEKLKMTKVSNKPITSFTISQDGALIAIASADLSITLLDAQALKVLVKIKDAHSFSITSIAISPDRRILASASADNSCRIVSLPLQFSSQVTINPLYTVLLACAIAGLLIWVLSIVDLQPMIDSSNNQHSIINSVNSDSVQMVDTAASNINVIDNSKASPLLIPDTITATVVKETDKVEKTKDEL
ncbi:WD40-repeat-containing domain protein [Mycotypha africana]|uniref:WD40-repeat-containing domain protein n=1 Tax=Mycotypha africana TaxID=64632 RepID=UPI002300ED5B|nr:WD40-repeat-containing domain protein [Mycotypha africana]KAI8992122.1 WD40-repeat-containing domain protein [Mycotypha africana]